MFLKFPKDFYWGTSTASAQIETATEHNWKGFKSKDGFTFDRTTDHELRREKDVEIIKEFGTVYRCGVDWARLQSTAKAPFDMEVVKEYRTFFKQLNDEGVKILFVIHHFTNPLWFEENGSWLRKENLAYFLNYADQCIEHFGDLVFNWNTFNEPNVYCLNAFITGEFPPQEKNYFKGTRAINNMAHCHDLLYDKLKKKFPDKQIGISLNTALFEGLNPVGKLFAKFTDWWFVKRSADLFSNVDYIGLSYYAHILFQGPNALTAIDHAAQLKDLGYPTDKMWAYNPAGLKFNVERLFAKYKKPILITENGICADDPQERIACLKDYLSIIHKLIEDGIPFLGYIHWSTFDNFEWNLGPTYRFGLASVDLESKNRSINESGKFYSEICRNNGIEI